MPVSPDDAAQLAKGLLDIYTAAELRLLELIGQAVSDGIDEPDWRERQLLAVQKLRAQTAKLLTDLQAAGSQEAAAAIYAAYNRGAGVAGADLANLGQVTAAGAFGGVDTNALSALVASTQNQLAATTLLIASQQQAIYRDVVAQTASKMLVEGTNRREASWQAMQTWADRGVTGFVDAAGRNWSMGAYAEMVARTSASQAIIQGHSDRLVSSGHDLAMISDAPEECSRCRPWEGKVVSLTGATKPGTYTEGGHTYEVAGTLAGATSAGLFHPNCRHRTVIFLPGITKPLKDTADPDGDKLRQQQRYKERRIRTLKKRAAVAEQTAGKGSPAAVMARGKLAAANHDFKAWREANGRKDLAYRTSIKTPKPAAPVAPNPPPGPPTKPVIEKTQLTGSFDPKPTPIVKTQLAGSFAPKITKTQLTGSFEPKVQKTQLTGSFAPKPAAPAPKPTPSAPVKKMGGLDALHASLKTKTATPAQVKQAVTKVPPHPPTVPKVQPAPPAKPAKVKAQATSVAPPAGVRPRTFKSNTDGRTWASEIWPDADGYTAEQLHALKNYTGEGYTKINTALRKSQGKRGGSRGLNSAMNAAPRVPEPILVTRGATESTFGIPKGADLSSLVGKQFTEHGYLSTSVDSRPGIGKRVHMNMHVPAGYKAVYVSGRPGAAASKIISGVGGGEAELLLDKGAQFTVTTVRKVRGGWVVDATVHP